jgi:sec-independent protein translocase protein TatA
MPSLVFQSFGWPELLIILVVLALVFGVGKLADVGGVLGRSIREFRRELKEDEGEEKKEEAAKVEGKSEVEEKKS